MDKQMTQCKLKILQHRKTNSGQTIPTVEAMLDEEPIYQDEVKTWQARKRKAFADGCITAIEQHTGRKLEKDEREKQRVEIDAWLMKLGHHLNSLGKVKEGSSATSPQPKKANEPEIKFADNVSLIDVHCALREIISSPYCGDICELTLATSLNAARKEDGLFWLLVIGNPSTGKTETVEGVRHEPRVYFLDNLTDKAFITGFVNADGSSPTDLLSELDGKILLVKDLTPLLSGKPEIAKSVLGQMVGIYDGSFSRKTGTRERVEYKTRFTFLACITPKAIESHQGYIRDIGSRLQFYIVPPLTNEEEEEGMNRLLENGKRTGKVERYRYLCSSYLHNLLQSGGQEVKLTEPQNEELKRMARLLARGRAVTVGSRDQSEFAETGDFQKEGPFRILAQLRSLVVTLALVHGRHEATDHEMELVRRVVLSTIPRKRVSVLALFQNPVNLTPEGGLTVKLCEKAEVKERTAQERLKELVNLGILEADNSQKEYQFKPLAEFADILAKPIESLDHIADAALDPSRNKIPPGVGKNIDEASRKEKCMGQVNLLEEIKDDNYQ